MFGIKDEPREVVGVPEEEIFALDIWIGAFGEDEFGELYLVDFNSGDFYRLDKR